MKDRTDIDSLAGRPLSSSRGVSRLNSRHFPDMLDFVPAVENTLTQLGPGPLVCDVALATCSQAAAIRVSTQQECLGTTVLRSDRIGLLVPLSWLGSYRVDGHDVEGDQAFLVDSPNGFFNRGKQRVFYALVVERQPFVDTLAALCGAHNEDIRLGSGKLQLPAGESRRLNRELSETLDHADAMTCSTFSQAIFRIFLETYLASDSGLTLISRKQKKALSIVKKSEDCFNASIDLLRPPSLADLCAAAGVSSSTLYEAFKQIVGMPPLKYCHLRRLNRAHKELSNHAYQRGRVAQVANNQGFQELGRFAVEYRSLFGVSPSVTLRKQ